MNTFLTNKFKPSCYSAIFTQHLMPKVLLYVHINCTGIKTSTTDNNYLKWFSNEMWCAWCIPVEMRYNFCNFLAQFQLHLLGSYIVYIDTTIFLVV